MHLIVADDSAVMRRIVVRALRHGGFDCEVTEASDGAELVELVINGSPDLVLSDWNMPNVTGIEALRTIRARGSDVPFGFVTSERSDAMRQQAADAGAAFLVGKPFTPEDLREAIAACV
ncbi:two-component system chemotaxis response regulator CheY [Jatrophihabitans sp. GAS493]|uniref:response regulator n=1 Tax=Jatrophihabitans sp. GAS493 TaxID=1907575 RepID=UPI000BB7C9C4|nr:response regulator [Jatrophihabitans sp. GAS493]SOD74510.1 two-component system chemotaxis response regulator CheY [Jatrophihabitans sp. GAS493]